MMVNKWSLYEDSEVWRYSFNRDLLEKNNGTYLDLLRSFIMVCYLADLSKVTKQASLTEEKYDLVVEDYLTFIVELSKLNSKGLYPRISSGSVYNYGNKTYYDYSFDNSIYYFDAMGNISYKCIKGSEIGSFFDEINHGQKGSKNLSLPFEFETYYGIGPDRQVKSFDFLIQLNSDIWLRKVPCSHCQKKVSNEVLRDQGGLSQIENYWHDNTSLSELNRAKLNLFMSKMNLLIQKYEGEVIIENEDLRLYRGKFNKQGFIENRTKPIA